MAVMWLRFAAVLDFRSKTELLEDTDLHDMKDSRPDRHSIKPC